MSEPRHRLRTLHVSDLHERGPREKEPWRRRRVLGDAWDRNLAELLQDGPVDLVCFTGDAADWGLPEEYEGTTHFFQGLLDRIGLKPDRLFVIPGNHDIRRPINKGLWSQLRDKASRVDRLDFARWMAGGSTPLGLEDDWGDHVLTRQSAYRRWVSDDLGRSVLQPERSPHGRLGYRSTVEIPELGFPIHVIGLDTAWLCGDNSDSGRLWLTDDQLMRLSTDSEGNALPGLRLVLMHHPFSDLADGPHCRKLLAGRADLVLRGHLHEQIVETWADPDRTVRQLAAGCLYEGDRADHYPNACQLVTIGLDDAGRPLSIDLRFRAFSPGGGHWHDDDSLYEGSRGGRLTWSFQKPVPLEPEGIFTSDGLSWETHCPRISEWGKFQALVNIKPEMPLPQPLKLRARCSREPAEVSAAFYRNSKCTDSRLKQIPTSIQGDMVYLDLVEPKLAPPAKIAMVLTGVSEEAVSIESVERRIPR